jgi:hypothetical protein
MKAQGFQISLGGVVFGVESDLELSAPQIWPPLELFQCDATSDVIIAVRGGETSIAPTQDELVFDSGGLWRLYGTGRRRILVSGLGDDGSPPDYVASFTSELDMFDVECSEIGLGEGWESVLTAWPLGQLIMVNLLGRGRGLLAHACGIIDDGRGYLFIGNSGHGKSTIAELWGDEAEILNDDRIIIREIDGRFRMYGTPWHGQVTRVSNKQVLIDKVFFLRQSDRNYASPVSGAQASATLLTRSFPPLWDPDGMEFTLEFVARFCNAVPFYILDFVRARSVVDFVRCMG